jgi:hypothetical protein
MSQMIRHGDRRNTDVPDIRIFSSPWLRRLALWLFPLAFLIIAFFYPLTRILALTFDFNTFTSDNLLLAYRILCFICAL